MNAFEFVFFMWYLKFDLGIPFLDQIFGPGTEIANNTHLNNQSD